MTTKKYLATAKITLPVSKGCGYKRHRLSSTLAFITTKRGDKWVDESLKNVVIGIQEGLESQYEGLRFDEAKIDVTYISIDDIFISPNFNKQ